MVAEAAQGRDLARAQARSDNIEFTADGHRQQ
jgi:hypothetical protein